MLPLDAHVDRVRSLARSGFEDEESMLDIIEEIPAAELIEDDITAEELFDIAREELAKLDAAEETWTTATVNDRIEAAFADLDEQGVLAIENAAYTMTAGWSVVNEIARGRADAGDAPRGATFYHAQDLERGVAGHGLTLIFGAYASAAERDAQSALLAREIVETLERYGVLAYWNGDVNTRIEIKPFEWRKRRTTSAPPILAPSVQAQAKSLH